VGCCALFAPILETVEAAVARWNRRISGAAGGRTTKGLTSRRKSRACRRNLRKARLAKKYQSVRAKALLIFPILRVLRSVQMSQTITEEHRAELKPLTPKIQADSVAASAFKNYSPTRLGC
jgi:hypothetical protein